MSLNILIMDDELAVSDSLSELILLRYGSKVSVDRVYRVAEFEEIVVKKTYDVIIADFNLPDGVGYQSMVKMLDECPWIAKCLVVFISGIPYVDLDPCFKSAQDLFENSMVRNKPIHSHVLYGIIDSEIEK
ncbi:MAG: response regulator [Candidatus Cloacimonetes bacterium]|nr:response regulator [Candidatus Cloacimonadota bacterium]